MDGSTIRSVRMLKATSCITRTDISSWLLRPNRENITAGDPLRRSVEEKAQAADTYISYHGQYKLHRDTVLPHMELSLYPNWVGVEQERLVELKGNRLTLSTRPILLGGN